MALARPPGSPVDMVRWVKTPRFTPPRPLKISDSRIAARKASARSVAPVQAATKTPLASLRGVLERRF